jgi:hypothetical protein
VSVATLAELGPFFAVETHTTGAAVEPWRPMSELIGPALRDRVLEVRGRLAAGGGQPDEAVELRVAASVTHLGLVARLLSPALAVAAMKGRVLDLDLAATWWQPVVSGAIPLSVRPAEGEVEEDPERLAAALARRVLDGPVRELTEATLAFSVSDQVLWGNVASAVNGALTMIDSAGPSWAGRARVIISALLARPPLRGTSTVTDGRFRRRSCCLIYRAAPDAAGPVCGDCVLLSER